MLDLDVVIRPRQTKTRGGFQGGATGVVEPSDEFFEIDLCHGESVRFRRSLEAGP